MNYTNTPERLIGYTRVSTKDQAREGVSLDAQRERLGLWRRNNGSQPDLAAARAEHSCARVLDRAIDLYEDCGR